MENPFVFAPDETGYWKCLPVHLSGDPKEFGLDPALFIITTRAFSGPYLDIEEAMVRA